MEIHKPETHGPSIKGLIKLHKPEHPIRPVVNWRGAPAYKLAQLFTQKFKLLAPSLASTI